MARVIPSGLAVLTFTGGVTLPAWQLKHPQVRNISRPLKLLTSKKNPPRLAFEEALEFRREKRAVAKATAAPAGANLNVLIGQGHLLSNRFALHHRIVRLTGLSFDKREAVAARQEEHLGQSHLPLRSVLPNEFVPERRFEPLASQVDNMAAMPGADVDWYQSLSQRQKRILEASGLRATDLEKGTMEPTLAEALAAKIDEELARIQTGAAPAGQAIVIRPSSQGASRENNLTGEDAAASKQQEPQAKKLGQYKVAGHFSLDSMTALLPRHHIEVVWKREGEGRKSGRFSLHDSSFQVVVDELIGQVKIEMFDDNTGAVVAEGGVRLSQDLSADTLQNLNLKLRPVGMVASTYTDFNRQTAQVFSLNKAKGIRTFGKTPIKAKVSFDGEATFEADLQGQLQIEGLASSSTSFALADHPDYYPALHMISAERREALPMIPRKTANALIAIIEDQLGFTDAQKNGSLVMGQVTSRGAALGGVSVEIEGHSETRPIYLNEVLIPDPKLTATTGSGYFVLLNLPQGFYSLRAMRGPQFLGFGNVINEPEAASFVEIQEPERFAEMELRTFDAFSGEPLAADMMVQALNQNLKIDGYGRFQHPILPRLSLIEASPQSEEYVPATYSYSGDTDHLFLPAVKQSWMDQLLAKARINVTPRLGALIVFSEKGQYQVGLPHLPPEAKVDIVYFDSQGNYSQTPVEHGGFMIVNLPPVAQTLVVTRANGEVVSRVFTADSDRLSIERLEF